MTPKEGKELNIEPMKIQLSDFKALSSMDKDQLAQYAEEHFAGSFEINLAQKIDAIRKVIYEEAKRLFELQKSRVTVEAPIPSNDLTDVSYPETEDDETVTMTKAKLQELIQQAKAETRKGMSEEELAEAFEEDGITPKWVRSNNNGQVFQANKHILERIGSEFTACTKDGQSVNATHFERIQLAKNKREVKVSDFDALD